MDNPTFEEMVSQQLDEMPDVSEGVATVAPDDAPAQSENVTDSSGTVFDPEKHLVIDGQPALTPKGRFRKIPKSRLNVSHETKSQLNQAAPDTRAQSHYAGAAAAAMLINMGRLISDDFAPVKTKEFDEQANLSAAFGNYFESKEITDFPAGVALSIAVIGYIAPRLTQESTSSRLGRFGGWCAEKYLSFKNKRAAKRAKKAQKKQDENQTLEA